MATVKELIFLESNGSCAHCGIRDSRVLTIHHIERSDPANESYDNKLLLCHNCHQCHHQDKGPSAEELREIKRRLIIGTLTRPGLNALKEAYRRSMVVAMPFLVNHLVEFGYLKYVDWISSDESEAGDQVITQAEYRISPNGRQLLEKWDLK